ncbi:MATE family efflux transporter [Prolixibacteraceae bacterium JC049]|nr:MATE family efflux transporter [Prolixibacteraceae bacterium JC049]
MSFKDYIPFYKRNLQVAIPVVLSQAGQVMVQQVDNMMVGHVGTNELAAASFAGSVFINGLIFGMGFSFGLTPLVGRFFGEKNFKRAGELFQNSIMVNLIMGLLLTAIMFGVKFFMYDMGQPKEVVDLAIPYYLVQVFSMIPFLLFFSFKQFAEGIGNTKVAMVVTLTANAVNILLNYILIFGKFGVEAYGLMGAGYATFTARLLMPILFFVVFLKKTEFNRYLQYISFSGIKWSRIRNLFSVGIPIGAQMVIEVMAFSLGSIMMGWLGAVPIAAHQIALGVASLTFMLASGVAQGTTIRVSHQLGAGNYVEMRKAVFASLHMVLAFMSMTALSFVIFRNHIPALYTKDVDVIALTSNLLIVGAVFQLFDGLQLVTLASLRGLADVKKPMYFSLLSFIVVALPVSYLCTFPLGFGPKGIWFGFLAGLGTASVLFYRRFNRLSLKMVEGAE